ncbi:hypothetical protein FRC00_005016, partial [Tulasnella sp. 408]
MKHLLAVLAAASLSLVSATVDFQSVHPQASSQEDIIPGAYFVELDPPSSVHGRRWNNTAHHALYSSLDKCGAKWSLRTEYNTPGIFVGATINLESDRDLNILADIPHVANIWPVYLHSTPPLTESRDLVLETAYAFDTFAPHVMTGVDKLHAEGFLGEGIKIAILDSGVDYRHPALGGGVGPDYKVSKIVDFSKDKDKSGGTVPDCEGHGTHVAGIIGANPNGHGFTGVAPKAKLTMYKLKGCDKKWSSEVTVQALIAVGKEKYDVLSMSIGSPGAWTEGASGVIAARIAAQGVVVVAAAGNDGAVGPFYVSSPSTGKAVISVAAIENTELLVQKAELDNGAPPIPYFSVDPLPAQDSMSICALSQDTNVQNEACSPLPDSTPNLSECVVIVRDGGCPLTQKAANLKPFGAQYLLFYSTGDVPRYEETPGFFSAMISKADGEYLVGRAQLGPDGPLLTFPQDQLASAIPNPVGGLTASFSSYGPTWDLEFKPNVAAPGTRILSTLVRREFSAIMGTPLKDGVPAYGMKSGTSMATPLVAGVAALLLEKHGKTKSNALGMRYLLETTAKTVRSSKKSTDPLQTVAKSGAGLLDAFKAMHGQTVVTPGEILLNDTVYGKPSHTITVKNTSKKAQTYKITHVAAGNMNAFDSKQKAIHDPVPLDKHYAEVKIKPNTLVIKPGQSAKFTVTIKPPKGVDAKKFPVYSGFVKIASASDSVHVSYMGVAAEMKKMKILDRTSDCECQTRSISFYLMRDSEELFVIENIDFKSPVPHISDSGGKIQTGSKTYTWTSQDHPALYYRLLAGSPLVLIDLVKSDFKLTNPPPKKISTVGRLQKLSYTKRNTDGSDDRGYNVFDPHRALYTSLDKREAKWSLRRQYDVPGIFVGAAINVASETDLVALAGISHVVGISPVYKRPRPKTVGSRQLNNKNAHALDSFAPHVMTGVDKLHAEGLFGKGIRVAIIDGGVDYLHPALGGGFGPGFKVSHGTDFVGDEFDGSNDPVPDDDPMDCDGHVEPTTHTPLVAGIVGADSNPYGFTGVAPQADIGMYKIFGCTGDAPDDVIIHAMLRAHEDRHDIISMSVGTSRVGWSEGAVARIASRIAASGVVVTVAAGNDGQYGAFYVASPSTGKNVISVASVESTQLFVQNFELNNGHSPIPYLSLEALDISGSWPIYATSQDTEADADACTSLPDSTPDLSKYVVLTRGGGCSYDDKAANVKAHGAKYVLFYNPTNELFYDVLTAELVSALILKEDGEYLVDQFTRKVNVMASFPQNQPPSVVPNPRGGLMASSSSYGPTWDLEFKPSVAAPGGSYGMKSGTSMAAPFTAGVAALILQKHGNSKKNALGMRDLLESTGEAVPFSNNSTEPLQTLARAGAGLLNAYNAVHSKTVVTPTELHLNDTAYGQKSHTITVNNTSNKAQKFKITHIPAGTMISFDSEQKAYPVPVIDTHYAKVTFKPSTLIVQPGKSAEFVATIHPPKDVDKKNFPVYSGFLQVASATSSVHVAYMGVSGNMKDMKIWDRTPGNNDFPKVVSRRLAGTPLLRIDLVSASAKLDARGIGLVDSLENIGRSAEDQRLSEAVPVYPGSAKFKRVPELAARLPKQTGKISIVGNLLTENYIGRNTNGLLEQNGFDRSEV